MIIDFHAHWWPSNEFVAGKRAWPMLISTMNDLCVKSLNIEISDPDLEKLYFDPEASMLINDMDQAGIDLSAIIPLDWGMLYGEAEKDIVDQNRVCAQLAEKHPDKFVSFFSIDPRRDGAEKHFATAVGEWGVKGLKLYPPTGFQPYDACCLPFYKICLDH